MAERNDARGVIVNRLTTRAWRDEAFRELLFRDARQALVQEFGHVPEGFENVRFQAREVDRATLRRTPGGHSLLVRVKRGERPISVVTRRVFGVSELVVVFYTRRCQYQCSFCTLPSTSASSDVPLSSIEAQVDHAFACAGDALHGIEQVSLGNEGSILDERTFPKEHLAHVLTRCSGLPSMQKVVLETRAEFVTEALLDEVLRLIAPCRLTLKIGLESADVRIREEILRKKMNLGLFENVVEMLGRMKVGLASYVLLKADPRHSDEEGREDARRTCHYLKETCRRSGTELTLRVNTMYRAEGSVWAKWAGRHGWEPPSIFDLAEVMLDVWEEDVKVFAGLYDEGLATRDGHYEARADYQPWALETLERYNQTMDVELLRHVATYRREEARAGGA